MKKRERKISLKKRISVMISIFNFISLLVMMVSMMIALGGGIKIISKAMANNVAKQMSASFKNERMRGIAEERISEKTSLEDSFYNDLYKSIGLPYRVASNIEDNPNHQNQLEISEPAVYKDEIGQKIPQMKGDKSPSEFFIVEYRIWANDKLIYSSIPIDLLDKKDRGGHLQDNFIMKILNTASSVDLNGDNNTKLAKLEVKLNPGIIFGGYVFLISVCVVIFILILIIGQITIRMLSSVIIRPLMDLDNKMNRMADGNIDEAMKTEIIMKKPIKEIENLFNSANKIIAKMHGYVNILENQKSELEAQNNALQDNSKTLESVNSVLANKNLKLNNILNNVEQGFLSFKKDLYIHNEYSLECERIFKGSISNKTLSAILYPNQLDMQKFTDDLLVNIFDSRGSKRELYLPLLPEEIILSDRIINISYKIVKDEKNEDIVMVIIKDITDKKVLEKQMDEERKILRMVVKAIINKDVFKELVEEYENFTKQNFQAIPSGQFEETLRLIHTFKGNFSQFDMICTPIKLNNLEDKLYEKNNKFNVNNIDDKELCLWLKEDLDIIESYAGSNFIKEGEICYIKKEKLIEIEKRIQQTLSQKECKAIMPLIRSLRYKSLKDLLKTYPEYVKKLSERLEKNIRPLKISGDEIIIDTNYYNDISKSLVHIFRNCVDHGIEIEDERLEQGKEQSGTITCNIRDLKDSFEITIFDDGRGINTGILEQKVLEEGIYSKEQLSEMDYKQKCSLIFNQGITTKEEATHISGRGFGLWAVKKCILELGGSIEVDSKPYEGTTFTIILPKFEDVEENIITEEEFIRKMAKTTKELIYKQTGINFDMEKFDMSKTIALNKMTALISLKGTLNSIIMISVNEIMAKKLVKGFMVYAVKEEELIQYAEDVLAEISNTILGNTFGYFENKRYLFRIGLPAVLCNTSGYVKYTESQIVSCKLAYEEYEFSINMLLNEDESFKEIIEEGI